MPPRRGRKRASEADAALSPPDAVDEKASALVSCSRDCSSSLSDCLDELSRRLGVPLAGEAMFDDSAPPFRCDAEGDDADTLNAGLRSLLASLPAEEYGPLWSRVLDATEMFLSPESAQEDAVPSHVTSHTVTAVASLLASFADEILDSLPLDALPEAFADTACLCQEHILTSDARTQHLIFQTLEKICDRGFEGSEQFYGAIMMFLLARCSQPKVGAADVALLHKHHRLFAELDWSHDSIENLKKEVLACTMNSSFVSKTTGPDLIAMFYSIDPAFTPDVNAAVKQQVIHCSLKVQKAYSVSLWKALRVAEDSCKLQVERCVQDWMLLAVRANRKMAEKARVILEEIHRHHLQPLERELLCRCYGPVLWRGLKVANAHVRENATRLLQVVFPLVSAELAVEAQELEMMKQLRFLRETLEDPNEAVRKTGILASAYIMKTYWELLPTHEVAQLLTTLKDRVISEKRSATVRAAVAEGLAVILENAVTHPTMEVFLPEVGPQLLHDRNATVRAASVSLLRTIAQCRSISTQLVIPHEELYLSLVSEHALSHSEWAEKEAGVKRNSCGGAELVAQGMAKLMAPSLFSVSLPAQVQRCLELMKKFPLALLALLSNAGEVVSLPDRVKLAVALFQMGKKQLEKTLAESPDPDAKQPMVTLLKAAGLLLAGTPLTTLQIGKCRSAEEEIPPELEQFVYEHLNEDDVLPLLQDDTGAADHMYADFLFALSCLDAQRIPRVVELVHCDLHEACRGKKLSPKRLMALMRAAAGWDILAEPVEPMFARLEVAAKRMSAHQHVTQDMQSVLALLNSIVQDPKVRKSLLLAKADVFSTVVQHLASGYCEAWFNGLQEFSAGNKTTEHSMLGAAAQWWPQALGLVLLLAQHLQHQLPNSTPSGLDPSADVHTCIATDVQAQVCAALTSKQSVDFVSQLESIARTPSSSSRPAKRARTADAVALPTDVDLILQIYERTLEALSASRYLRPLLMPGDDNQGDSALERNLHDMLWRWADAADALRPVEEGPSRKARIWVSSGHIWQQVIRTKVSTPNLLLIAKQLFGRITDEVPEENSSELKRVVRMMLWQFHFKTEPEVEEFLWSILRERGDTDPEENLDEFQPSARLTKCVKEQLPQFWKLKQKFMPEIVPALTDDMSDDGHAATGAPKLQDAPASVDQALVVVASPCRAIASPAIA